MTTPTWNQIAAPNFSAGNDLIAQAMEQLSKLLLALKALQISTKILFKSVILV